MEDEKYMNLAIEQAHTGRREGGIPIGASLVTNDGKVLGVGRNRRVQMNSPTRHGEIDCLENIGRLPAKIYHQSTMYTTLSPCHMCTGAILLYGIPRVVIGENETFQGAEELLRSKGVQVVNLQSKECIDLMKNFINDEPELWNEDIGI